MSRFVVWIVFALAVVGCRGELHQVDGNVELRVALSPDGLRVLDIKDVGELPNPPVQGEALSFAFRPSDGGPVVEGQIADSRLLRSEFDRAGQPDPQLLVADFGLLDVRIPASAGTLEVRDRDGQTIGTLAVDPDSNVRQSALMRAEDVVGMPVKIVDHGPSIEKADLIFLPEGYTESELGQFHAHVDFIVEQLQGHSGYRDHWSGFNVWRQDVRSRNSGTGTNGVSIDTAFDTASGIAGTERCVFFTSPEGQEAALRLARDAGADAIVVLVNSPNYGGCAAGGIAVTARPANVADVVGHELGHSLFGLADEYETSRPSGGCTVGPNVAIRPELEALPWADMVNTSELPTPASAPFGTIGAFPGAGYCAHGRFRPSHNCMMRNLGVGMCKVCKREMARTMATLAPESGDDVQSVTLTNKTGEPIWARCDGAPSLACSDWVLMQTEATESLNTHDRRVVLHSPDGLSLFDMHRTTVPAETASIFANPSSPFTPAQVDDAGVEAPSSLSPDLAQIEGTQVELSWAHPGAARYAVAVEMETPNGWVLFASMDALGTSVNLQLGGTATRYRWHVEACDEGDCVRSLQAVFEHHIPPVDEPEEPGEPPTIPNVPATIAPPHEAVVSTGDVELSWASTGTTYAVNVRVHDPVLGWVDHIHERDLSSPSLSIDLEVPNTWYAWTAQSCSASGCSDWAEYSLIATTP